MGPYQFPELYNIKPGQTPGKIPERINPEIDMLRVQNYSEIHIFANLISTSNIVYP
jgi:hypothetical protein